MSEQTKESLNAGFDFSAFDVPVNVGGSIERTKSQTWGVSNTSTRTIKDSAPKGYYSYNVCMNTYKIKLVKNEDNATISRTFFAPRSEPYRAIVYNPNNASYTEGLSRY